MKKISNRLITTILIILWIASVLWNIYSYLCVGLTYRYSLYGITQSEVADAILDYRWSMFELSVIVSCFIILLCVFLYFIKNTTSMRLILYTIIAIYSMIMLYSARFNCEQLQDIISNETLIKGHLRGEHYLYSIVNVGIGLLLLIAETIGFKLPVATRIASDPQVE